MSCRYRTHESGSASTQDNNVIIGHVGGMSFQLTFGYLIAL